MTTDPNHKEGFTLPAYGGLAIFENVGGEISIQQTYDFRSDPALIVIRKSDVPAIISELQRLAGI